MEVEVVDYSGLCTRARLCKHDHEVKEYKRSREILKFVKGHIIHVMSIYHNKVCAMCSLVPKYTAKPLLVSRSPALPSPITLKPHY